MPIEFTPSRRLIDAYLKLRKRLRGENPEANQIKSEAIEAVNEDGTYVVKGANIPASGNVKLSSGQRVDVVFKNARPRVIVGHNARRAHFGPDVVPIGNGVVEELLILQNQIYFRNDRQFTQLKINNLDIEFESPPLGVRWGLDRQHFHVVMENHIYNIYKITRDPAKVLAEKTPVVKFIKQIALETMLTTLLFEFFTFSITESKTYTVKWMVFPIGFTTDHDTLISGPHTLGTAVSGTFTVTPQHFMHLSGPDIGQFKELLGNQMIVRIAVTDVIVNADGHLIICLSLVCDTCPGDTDIDQEPFVWARLGTPPGPDGFLAPVNQGPVGEPFLLPTPPIDLSIASAPAFEHHAFFINATLEQVLWRSLPLSFTASRLELKTVSGPGHNAFNVFNPAIALIDPGFVDPLAIPPDYYRIGAAQLAIASSIMFNVGSINDEWLIAEAFAEFADSPAFESETFEISTPLGYTFFNPVLTPVTPLALTVLASSDTEMVLEQGIWIPTLQAATYRRINVSSSEAYAARYQLRILRLLRWDADPLKQRLVIVVTADVADEPFVGQVTRPERVWIYIIDGQGKIVRTVLNNRAVFQDFRFTVESITPRHVLLQIICTISDVINDNQSFLYLIDLETGLNSTVTGNATDTEPAVLLQLYALWPRFVYSAAEPKRRFLASAFNKLGAPILKLTAATASMTNKLMPPADARLKQAGVLIDVPKQFVAERQSRWDAWFQIVSQNIELPSSTDLTTYQIFEWQSMPPMDVQLITDTRFIGVREAGKAFDSQVKVPAA